MFFAIFLVIFGLLFGSFLNVCICRIPLGEDIVITPSHCPQCNKKLLWYELIPILSFIIQRGRCRSCGKKISPQYPIIEAANAALWFLAYIELGTNAALYPMCFLLSMLLVIGVIDGRTKIIPNGLNIAVAIGAIANIVIKGMTGAPLKQLLITHGLGAVVISGVMVLIIYLWGRLRGEEAFGFGDVKLLFTAGLFMGLSKITLAYGLACVLGSFIHLFRMKVLKNAGRELAFGPYLAAGLAISALWGEYMIKALFPY